MTTGTFPTAARFFPAEEFTPSTYLDRVLVDATVETFVDGQLRRVVNRRPRWSMVSGEVGRRVRQLADDVTRISTGVRAPTPTTMDLADALVDLVRRASNRRWPWFEARPLLLMAVTALVNSAARS